jgi:hypothetical protein
LALPFGTLDVEAYETTVAYVSPVPIFASGNEAADHGQVDIWAPGLEAARLMDKIFRVRGDLDPT